MNPRGAICATKPSLQIFLTQGCFANLSELDNFDTTPDISFDEVRGISINSVSSFYDMAIRGEFEHIDRDIGDLTQFTITQGEDTSIENYTLNEFLPEGFQSFIRFRQSGPLDVFLRFALVNSVNGEVEPSSVSANISINGDDYPLSAVPGELDRDSEAACQHISTSGWPAQQDQEVLSSSVGILLRFGGYASNDLFNSAASNLVIFPGSGWATFVSDEANMVKFDAENVRLFSVGGPFERASIPSALFELDLANEISGFGEFRVETSSSGATVLRGQPNHLWIEEERALATRWEAWGWEVRGIFLSTISVILFALWSFRGTWLKEIRNDGDLY